MLALIVGVVERARISDALRGRFVVEFADRVAGLEHGFNASGRPLAGVILESHDADRRTTADLIRFMRGARPHVPVVGYCRAGIAHSSDVLALAVAGVNELLFHGVDDTGAALRAVLAAARQSTVGHIVAEALVPHVPDSLWPLIRHVAAHPAESQRVADVARVLGYHRKTLVNHCAKACAPPPQELIAWCRIAVVGHLLDSSTSTVEAIALQLDFPSDTALRNLLKRYVGLRATTIRASGGLSAVVAAFQRAVAASGLARGTPGRVMLTQAASPDRGC